MRWLYFFFIPMKEGVCSWYGFAKATFEFDGMSVKVNPIQTGQYPTPTIKPFYSLLNKSKIKENNNFYISYWTNSLEFFLKNL